MLVARGTEAELKTVFCDATGRKQIPLEAREVRVGLIRRRSDGKSHMYEGSRARSFKVTSLGKNLEFDDSNLSAGHHSLKSSSASYL